MGPILGLQAAGCPRQSSHSESVAPGSALLASHGNLLEMQILGPCSRLTESETLGLGTSRLCFNKLSE